MPSIVSRRSLLNAAARVSVVSAGALAASRPALSAQAAPSSAGFKLGVASYSFREFSRHLAIEDTRRLRVDYINIKEFHLPLNSSPEEIAHARAEFEKAGLTILGGGNVSFQTADEADIRKKFEYARLAGMPLIVCAPTHETLPMMEKYVKEFDIKIAIHNHGPEDKHFPTPQSALEAVRNMDPRCGLCIDVGHTARTGVDVVESVREAGPRLLDMHVKDLADMGSKESQVPVGEGKMPIPGIFKELIRMNYRGGVMLEYEIDGDNPMPGMQKSFSYMRGVLAGMQA